MKKAFILKKIENTSGFLLNTVQFQFLLYNQKLRKILEEQTNDLESRQKYEIFFDNGYFYSVPF